MYLKFELSWVCLYMYKSPGATLVFQMVIQNYAGFDFVMRFIEDKRIAGGYYIY